MSNKLALKLFEIAKFNKKQKIEETHEKENGHTLNSKIIQINRKKRKKI